MLESSQDRVHRIRQLRSQIKERIPDASRTLRKSGMSPSDSPFNRLAINIAGGTLRTEMQSETDELTGLINRKRFERRLEEEVSRARRNREKGKETKLTLLMLDLNSLKETNDGPGRHEAGDALLKSTADSLREVSRISDIISRYGGDEFVALLPDTDIDGGMAYWVKLNVIFSKKNISIGAGISEVNLDDDIKDIMAKVDEAMYKSKEFSKTSGQNILVRAGELQHV